jgi:uncharacterized protein YqjF (DUF2071 family)
LPRAFLTAEWRNLVLLNFAVEPSLLSSFVPAGTELDAWEGKTFVSLVGFLFANTRVLGLSLPWHRTFEEVNLRFYVRRSVDGETRRAVVFIREIVPRIAIASVARVAYNEPYRALPMRHEYGAVRPDGVPASVEYGWRLPSGWSSLRVEPAGKGRAAVAGSQEEFITEHYWGYTRQRDGSTMEYQVAHPSWRVWAVESPQIEGELASLYGSDMARVLGGRPASAFLADGSPVTVYSPSRLPDFQAEAAFAAGAHSDRSEHR